MRTRRTGRRYAIFCLVFTSVITKSCCEQVKTAFACIGSEELKLDCPNESDRIEVLAAIVADSRCYKYSSACCPDRADCSGPVDIDHRRLLDRRCTGRSSCRLQVDRMLLNCPSLGRRPYDNDYENVTYRCVQGDDIINAVPSEEDAPASAADEVQSSTESNVTASHVIYTAAQHKGASSTSRRVHLIFGTFTAVSVLLNCVLLSAIFIAKRKRRQSILQSCNRTPTTTSTSTSASSSSNTVCSTSDNSNRRDPGVDPGHWYEPLAIRIDHTYSHVHTYVNDIRSSSIYQDIIY